MCIRNQAGGERERESSQFLDHVGSCDWTLIRLWILWKLRQMDWKGAEERGREKPFAELLLCAGHSDGRFSTRYAPSPQTLAVGGCQCSHAHPRKRQSQELNQVSLIPKPVFWVFVWVFCFFCISLCYSHPIKWHIGFVWRLCVFLGEFSNWILRLGTLDNSTVTYK